MLPISGVFLGALLAIFLCTGPLSSNIALKSKNSRLNAQTTFLGFEGCSPSQGAQIMQAHRDALTLAHAAMDNDADLLISSERYHIDFSTFAAVDYFGPAHANKKWRPRILETFIRATLSYRGIGWGDWWSNRYVKVACQADVGTCKGALAHTDASTKPYQTITYCGMFFDKLESHGEMAKRLRSSSSAARSNVQNAHSQGKPLKQLVSGCRRF